VGTLLIWHGDRGCWAF